MPRRRVRQRDLSITVDEGTYARTIDGCDLSIFGPSDRGGTDRLVQIVVDDTDEHGLFALTIREYELRAALGPAATPEGGEDRG